MKRVTLALIAAFVALSASAVYGQSNWPPKEEVAPVTSQKPRPPVATTRSQERPPTTRAEHARRMTVHRDGYSLDKPRNWDNLGGDPLKNPFDRWRIEQVVAQFSILHPDVRQQLADKVARRDGGRPIELCKGDVVPGMSFGDGVVWDYPVRLVWKNHPRQCTPGTAYDVRHGDTWYTIARIHACKNLNPLWPEQMVVIPPRGPQYGLVPAAECPPTNPNCNGGCPVAE